MIFVGITKQGQLTADGKLLFSLWLLSHSAPPLGALPFFVPHMKKC